MTFKELKKSSIYQTSDFDDMPVMISVCRNGKRQYEPLCFMGVVPMEDVPFVVIGGLTEVQRMVESGEMKPPAGYIPPEETKDLLDGDQYL